MFGLIVAGRLVQTNFSQIPTDPSKFLIDIPHAEEINHVVVFLTGTAPFAPGVGGQIYFSWPDPSNQVAWHLLGYISNEKPSAIFKISNLKKTQAQSAITSSFFGQLLNSSTNAQIGISVEPLDLIQQATPVQTADPSKVSYFAEYTQKMLQNFVNYVTSFGDPNYVSMNTVQNWYANFQRRLEADPYFWR
jgi:hypothetical protein